MKDDTTMNSKLVSVKSGALPVTDLYGPFLCPWPFQLAMGNHYREAWLFIVFNKFPFVNFQITDPFTIVSDHILGNREGSIIVQL